jgi:hypothetical protein
MNSNVFSFLGMLGEIASLAVMVGIFAAISKVFQMATTLNEIKDLLTDIKRNTFNVPAVNVTALAQGSHPNSPEALVRAIHATPEATEAALYDTER